MLRPRGDDGLSTLELGFVIPILLLLLAAGVPILQAGVGYVVANRAAAAGVRYASRADENARRRASDGELTRRPSSAEVETFVRNAASPVDPASVTTYVGNDVGSPDDAMPGEQITVIVTYYTSFGPLAALANTVSSVFFRSSGELLPSSKLVSVSAVGREE